MSCRLVGENGYAVPLTNDIVSDQLDACCGEGASEVFGGFYVQIRGDGQTVRVIVRQDHGVCLILAGDLYCPMERKLLCCIRSEK